MIAPKGWRLNADITKTATVNAALVALPTDGASTSGGSPWSGMASDTT
jgi:hypothetical protein